MKLLLTAFDPFAGNKINPAFEAVKLVKDNINNIDIVKLLVPTVFNKSIETVKSAIKTYKPEVVLCIGQAGGRGDITCERVAINIDDARIPDNEGNQPIDMPIFKDGKNAYFSNLPIKAMVKYIHNEGLPASISNSAGTYVCNHLMYGVLYILANEYPSARGGFMHVPYIPSQFSQLSQVKKGFVPSLELEDIVKGIEAAIKAIGDYKKDIKTIGGKEH